MEYILKEKKAAKSNNPFVELAGEKPSEENLVLYNNSKCMAVLNKFPYNNGHTLVLPTKEISNVEEIEPSLWIELSTLLKTSIEVVKTAMNCHGINVGLNLGSKAGAGIPEHLHWHIVPRWDGDTNFMPVIAETKCLPKHILTTYRELKPFFDKI